MKSLAVALNWHNIMDNPFSHLHLVKNDEIPLFIEYCDNDVDITDAFYELSKSGIKLRYELSSEFKINLLSANEPAIGSEIFASMLSDSNNIPIFELKKQRTFRTEINIKDVLLSFDFKTKRFKDIYEKFKLLKVKPDDIKQSEQSKKGKKKSKGLFNLIIDLFSFDFGYGGLHGSLPSGIYVEDEIYGLLDVDVESFYPKIGINNGFYPEHLGKIFCFIYESIFQKRKAIPKSNPLNGAYKLMLNGSYGKSKDKYSFLYDPRYTMQITCNGQLYLCILAEELYSHGYSLIQANTDGITIKYPKVEKAKVLEICRKWEEQTKFVLEYVEYSKMIIADVNNYIAVYKDEKKTPKMKGKFELDKALHKDNSKKIVYIALYEYFVNGIDIETTIRNHNNIYDFCLRQKFQKDSQGILNEIIMGDKYSTVQQKTVRYFISITGGILTKKYLSGKSAGKVSVLNKRKLITIFNKYEKREMKDYNINYSYYINEAREIINEIEKQQLSLF